MRMMSYATCKRIVNLLYEIGHNGCIQQVGIERFWSTITRLERAEKWLRERKLRVTT